MLPDNIHIDDVEQKLIDLADNIHNNFISSAYKVPATTFKWGSNSRVANGGIICLQAYHITGNDKYLDAIMASLDYLLGRNPTKYSFISGFGSLSPMNPHDRKSFSDGVDQPIPGMLMGGPNPNNMNDCGNLKYPSSLPALAYIDDQCSYSTNEITINWNSPLSYLLCGLKALD